MSTDAKPSGNGNSILTTIGFVIGALFVIGITVRGCKPDHPTTQLVQITSAPQPQATEANTPPEQAGNAHPGDPVLCGVLPWYVYHPKDANCPATHVALNQPPETVADASIPKPGVTTLTAPAEKDGTNPEDAANWSPWVRGHPGYTIYEMIDGQMVNYAPGNHDSRFKMECWDVVTGTAHVITDTWCQGSAFRYQSTSGQPLEMGTGFFVSAK